MSNRQYVQRARQPAQAAQPPSWGRPLPSQVRGRFERMFGANFSDVRVYHEGSLPPNPLRAFTRGPNLHFAPGRFRPGTREGDALIGHELAHVTQQREGRVRPDGGNVGPFNTQPVLEREAHEMGDRAARGEATRVSSSAAKPQAPCGPEVVQAGLFDLMGKANPRLYAPTWLGGHSEDHLEERKWQGRSGPMDLLGPANPRLYLPTAVGGHSAEHLAERREQRRSGPMDLLGPANPRLHLPTWLGGHSQAHLAERAIRGRSGPLDLLGPANPRQYLPSSLGGHSYQELSRRQRIGVDTSLTAMPRSLVGKAVRKVGKATGSQALNQAGKKMDYGHLSPEQLLKQHPSAFLRQHPIESDTEFSGNSADLAASARRRFYLARYAASVLHPPGYTLRLAGDARHVSSNEPKGPVFHGAFLPMRQMANDAGAPNTVTPGGDVSDAALDAAGEDTTFTTQLSGCSITHQGGTLRHLRPHTSGATLQTNLNALHTYGRHDYANTSFVMTRKKANGRTRIYHQRDNNPTTSGKRYLS